MTKQFSMFAEPPYVRSSETSREAAEAIAPAVGSIRERVFNELRRRGPDGATDEELQRVLGMNPNTQRPARIRLTQIGRVINSGRVRLTVAGPSCRRVGGPMITTDTDPVNDWVARTLDALGPRRPDVKWD